jgi:uncharacterized protein
VSPELRRLTAADVRRVPWKNGRGVTEELAIWPPGASFERGDFDWRIARAGVAEDGHFSMFPGFERVLVVIAGDGLRLRHGAASPVRVFPLQPHRFSGDEVTQAELLGAPVTDLNLLLRRGRVAGEMELLRRDAARIGEGTEHALVLAVGRTVVRLGPAVETLAAGELLWVRGAAAAEPMQIAEGLGVLLRIRAAAV